jgi:hypothetical protein
LRDKLEQHLAEMEASLESRSTQATFHEEATGSLF